MNEYNFIEESITMYKSVFKEKEIIEWAEDKIW